MGKVDAPPPRGDFDDQREEEEEEEEDVLLVFDVRDLIVFFVSFFFSLWDRKVKNLFGRASSSRVVRERRTKRGEQQQREEGPMMSSLFPLCARPQ